MANLEKKSFDNPDELKTPEKTNAAVVNFGIIRIDFQGRKADIELHGLNEGVVLSKTLHFDKPNLTVKGL